LSLHKRFFLIPIFIIATTFLLFSSYRNVKDKVLRDFNRLQMAMAVQASYSIEKLFVHFNEDLEFLATTSHIIHFDFVGMEHLKNFQKLKKKHIVGVTRMDEHGSIRYTYPERPDLIGADISNQDHVKRILATREPVLSDVFLTVQGYKAIAFHFPVFDNQEFRGSIVFLISFDTLAEEYLHNIGSMNQSYAWVLSKKGIELSCPNPNHVGKHVHTNSKMDPDIMRLVDDMLKGKDGTATYYYTKLSDNASQKKHAVFCPVNIVDTMWSIVVATPEKDILSPMKNFRDKWLIIIVVLIIGMSFYVFFTLRTLTIIRKAHHQGELASVIEENEKNMRKFVLNSPIPTAFNNPASNFTLLNHAFTYATGYYEDDIHDLKEWFGKFLPNKQVMEDTFRHLENTISGGPSQDNKTKLVDIQCKNDTIRTFDFRYSRIGSRHILTLIDMTDKLKAEKHQSKLEEKLARAKKMEALGLLAGGVAHDLNNILSGIVTYPELILLNLEETSALRKPVNAIMQAGKRAAAVVNDLLTLTRGAAHRETVFDLCSLVKDFKNDPSFFGIHKTKSHIEYHWDIHPNGLPVKGSEHHLRKALASFSSSFD